MFRDFFIDEEMGGTKEDINRHKENACKMVQFSEDYILPEDCDLMIDTSLIFDIL